MNKKLTSILFSRNVSVFYYSAIVFYRDNTGATYKTLLLSHLINDYYLPLMGDLLSVGTVAEALLTKTMKAGYGCKTIKYEKDKNFGLQ
jgi:hypothetical protein